MRCMYEHEGMCALEVIQGRKKFYKQHPCPYARYTDGNTILRTCTATDKDLVEYDEEADDDHKQNIDYIK